MSMWNSSETGKPLFANNDPHIALSDVVATEAGWEHVQNYTDQHGNVRVKSEILVALNGASGGGLASNLGAATIVSTYFTGSTTPTDNANNAVSVVVEYNEVVNVDTTGGTPTLVLVNGNESGAGAGNLTLDYASGNNTNELVFTGYVVDAFGATDVLTITPTTSNVTLNSGTITDAAGTADNSETAITAGHVSAGGNSTATVQSA